MVHSPEAEFIRRMHQRNQRHPFEALVMVAALLTGGCGLAFGAVSPNIQALLPHWVLMWCVCTLVGGIIGLVGMFLRPPFGLIVERYALFLLGTVLLVYSTAICVVDTAFVSPGAIIMGSLSAASYWRLVLNFKETRELRHLSREVIRRGR